MGMFAGSRSYDKGDLITDSDLVIPVFDLEWHNGEKKYNFLWNEYVWSGKQFAAMDQETDDPDSIHVCSGGMGAAPNCMLPLVNCEDHFDSFKIGLSGVSPQSPGAGAYTPYYGRKFLAKKHIEPGAELYIDYGAHYFRSRDDYYDVPFPEDYKRADYLLARFQRVFKRVINLAPLTSEKHSLKHDLWNLVKEFEPWDSARLRNALPMKGTNVETVLQSGGTSMQHYNASIRPLEWLEEHGRCMDNIKDGVSTVSPHAGRGAFANRFIPAGGLVAPAPLIHLPDRRILTMYDSISNNDLLRDESKPEHQQLLLNYCFGHHDSSVLLCPYGHLTALINHSKEPNTKIVWAKEMRNPEWIQMTPSNWGGASHAGLSFDFVALRDIEEDEEILIDYGDEWEEAWQRHVREYDPPRRMYVPAFELNNMADLRIRTVEEGDYEKDGVYMFCRERYLKLAGFEPKETSTFEDTEEEKPLHPCRVSRRINDDSYVAEILERHSNGDRGTRDDVVKHVLMDIPRDAFYFKDGSYQREHHKEWSFRHEMRIPDSMFPDAWRNTAEWTSTAIS